MTLKITATYLIVAGIYGIILQLFSEQEYPEFLAKSIEYKFVYFAREYAISFAFMVSGVGIFIKKKWARKVGLIGLFFAFFYHGYAFAWAWSDGKPPTKVVAYSYVVAFIWYGVWFSVLFRQNTIKHLSE